MSITNALVGATVALAVAGLAWPALAQDPPAPAPDGPDTIYIPYKDLEKVFETEGQGVFLPYKEFLKLWRAGRPPGLAPTAPPPVPAAITAAEYTGQVVDTVARITARYDVRVLAEGWTEVPLQFGELALSNVQIEGPEGALLTTGKQGHTLLAPRPGTYRLTVELAARVAEQPGIRSLKLTVPAAPRARLDLTLPGTDLGVTLKPNLAATIGAGDVGDTTRVLAFLGPARTLDVEWKPRTRVGPDRQPLLMARTETAVSIEEGAVQVNAQIHYTILQAPADRFTLRVPRDYQVLALSGANLRSWDTRDEQGLRVIEVLLHSPVEDRYQIDLHLERLVPDVTGDLPVPQVTTQGTERERGAVAIGAPGSLALSVGTRQGLTQKDPGITPKPLLAHLPDGAADLLFEYLGGARELTLRVAKVTARIRAVVAGRLDIGEARHQFEARIDLDVERVGIFSVETVVPPGWEPVDVQPENLVDDWRLADHAEGRQLSIDLKGQREGHVVVLVRLQRAADADTGTLGLPTLRVLGAEKETGTLGVAVPPGFKVTTVADSLRGFRPTDLANLGNVRRDDGLKLGFSYTRHPLAGSVEVERLTAQVSARVYSTLSVKEGVLAVEYQLHYTIEHAGVRQFRFSVPEALSELRDAIHGEGVKQISKPEAVAGADPKRVAYTVDLQGDVLGTYVLTVKYETKLAKTDPGVEQTVGLPRLDALDVFSQDEHVAITKADNVVLTPTRTGYDFMDARELEGPMRARQSEVVLALRYAGDPTKRSLSLGVRKYDFAKTVRTAVTHLHTDAVFAGGRSIQAMTYLQVQNAQRQNLTVRLAPGSKIAKVIVAGEERAPSLFGDPTKPEFKDVYLIDLSPPTSGGGPPRGAPFLITIRWERTLEAGLQVASPAIVAPADDAVPVALETMRLFLPEEEHVYLGVGTNMRRTDRRAGLFAALTEWLGWDRRPHAEWQRASQRIAEMVRAATQNGGALTVPLVLPNIPPRGFLRHEGGGKVAVSYLGYTTAQILKVLVFLAAVAGIFWMTWAQGTSRLGAVGVPAGAALLLSAMSETLTPFCGALLLGAVVVGVTWVAYTLLVELPAAWRQRGGGWTPPSPSGPEAPGGAPGGGPPVVTAPPTEPASDASGDDAGAGEGDGEDDGPDATASGPKRKKAAKRKSGRSKKQGGGDE